MSGSVKNIERNKFRTVTITAATFFVPTKEREVAKIVNSLRNLETHSRDCIPDRIIKTYMRIRKITSRTTNTIPNKVTVQQHLNILQ